MNGKKKKRPEREPLDDVEEAKALLSKVESIESNFKRNLASPDKSGSLYVDPNNIKRSSAAIALPSSMSRTFR